jgi:hypothetical protein
VSILIITANMATQETWNAKALIYVFLSVCFFFSRIIFSTNKMSDADLIVFSGNTVDTNSPPHEIAGSINLDGQ